MFSLGSLMFSFLLFFFVSFAHAAELRIGTYEDTAAILISADVPINALEGIVVVPPEVTLVEISTENTAISFWIKQPELSANGREITFAGIIPGGFSGKGLLFRVKGNGDLGSLAIDKERTRLLVNDGVATPEIVRIAPPVPLPEEFRADNDDADVVPPMPFTPEIAVIPTEDGERPYLIFETKDNKAVVRYEIAFSEAYIAPDAVAEWFPVEHPYRLAAEHLETYIYIRAIDEAGNIRIEVIPPAKRSVSRTMMTFAILIGGAVLAALYFGVRNRTMQVRMIRGEDDPMHHAR